MATLIELNQIINLIKYENQNEGNTKERVARALELLRDLDVWVKNQEGKSLSTNDFTNHYKQKLDSLQNVDISGKLDKGTYTGNAKDLENLINTKVTQEPGKGLISDAEKTDIAENKKKRVEDFTITGDVDKIFTLIYNDGSTKAKNFTDIVGQSGADVMLNSLNFNKDTGVLTGVRSDGQQITVDLNGRFALLNHSHAWNDITGKPATFPPSSHTHVVNWNDVQNKPNLETTLLKITSNVNTEDLIDNVPQKGRTIVTQGTANIIVTVNSEDGFVASYQKAGTGNITFQASGGKNLIQVDNVHVIDGMKGSTATITVIGNEVLLRISNA